MDNQLTIPKRCHNTTGTPLSNKITTTTRGTKTLEEQRKVETNTYLHLRKHSNSTRNHITKTMSRFGPTPRNTYIENVDKNTRDTKSPSWLSPKSTWWRAKDGIRITRRYPLRRTPFAIAHVRYIKILTWIWGVLVILLYLVWFSLCSSFFLELRDNRVLKNLQFWL